MMQSYMPPPGGRPGPTAARQTMNPGGQPLPQQANPMARQAMMAKALRGMPGSAPAPLPTPAPAAPMPSGPIANLSNPMQPGPVPAPTMLPGTSMRGPMAGPMQQPGMPVRGMR